MKMKYNEKGEEIPDPTAPEVPLGFKKPESLAQQVARLVRSEQVRQAAQAAGHETFEEADDFNVGDDYDPRSPYEEVFDPTANEAPEVVREVERLVQNRKARKKDAALEHQLEEERHVQPPKKNHQKKSSGDSGEPEGRGPRKEEE